MGEKSEVYREIIRAFETNKMVHLLLEQSSIDSLDAESRLQLANMVANRIREITTDVR